MTFKAAIQAIHLAIQAIHLAIHSFIQATAASKPGTAALTYSRTTVQRY